MLLVSGDTSQRLHNTKKRPMLVFSSCRHFPISIQYCHHQQQDPFQLASKENWFVLSNNFRIFVRYFFFYGHGSRSQLWWQVYVQLPKISERKKKKLNLVKILRLTVPITFFPSLFLLVFSSFPPGVYR